MKADSGLEIQDDFVETDGQITITRILNGKSHYISSLNFYEPSEEEEKPYDEDQIYVPALFRIVLPLFIVMTSMIALHHSLTLKVIPSQETLNGKKYSKE